MKRSPWVINVEKSFPGEIEFLGVTTITSNENVCLYLKIGLFQTKLQVTMKDPEGLSAQLRTKS